MPNPHCCLFAEGGEQESASCCGQVLAGKGAAWPHRLDHFGWWYNHGCILLASRGWLDHDGHHQGHLHPRCHFASWAEEHWGAVHHSPREADEDGLSSCWGSCGFDLSRLLLSQDCPNIQDTGETWIEIKTSKNGQGGSTCSWSTTRFASWQSNQPVSHLSSSTTISSCQYTLLGCCPPGLSWNVMTSLTTVMGTRSGGDALPLGLNGLRAQVWWVHACSIQLWPDDWCMVFIP